MAKFGKPLQPLFKNVKYIATAHSSSTKDFKEEYKEAEDIDED